MEGPKLARQDLEIEMGAVVGFIWRDWKKKQQAKWRTEQGNASVEG